MQPILFKVEIENEKYKLNYDGGVSREWDGKEIREFFSGWMKDHKLPKQKTN